MEFLMKLKMLLILFMCFLCFGCSNILQTFAPSDFSIYISQTSGDELKIATNKNDNSPGKRDIIDNQGAVVGYIKINAVLTDNDSGTFVIDTKKLNQSDGNFKIPVEILINNTYLEIKNGQYDKILLWLDEASVTLFQDVYKNSNEITEENQGENTLFEFCFSIEKIKNFNLSIQSINIIK